MDKFYFRLIILIASLFLSACVTQNFENDDTPVVENETSKRDKAITRISLGLGYLKMGNMSQAKLNLERAKLHAPDFVQVHTAFAHYYEKVGEHKLTVESYEKAISLDSEDADTLNNYGVYLCRQGQIEAAEKQFLKAIAVPSYLLVAQSYENLAMCELKIDNFKKAELYLNKAILHSPSSASTLSQMVSLQYAMGNYKQAKTYLQRFEKVTRRFSAQSLALAFKVHYKLRERKTAKNYGAMLVKMFPQSWEAKQYMLNNLERIDADVLAERYTKIAYKSPTSEKKKRIVVLSPKSGKSNYSYNKKLSVKKAPKKKIVPVTVVSAPKTDIAMKKATGMVAETKIATKAQAIKANPPVKLAPTHTSTNEKIDSLSVSKVVKPEALVQQTEIKTEVPLKAIHTVEKGDNLYSISVKYNVYLKTLRRWNNLAEDQRLYVGDKIYVVDPKGLDKVHE